MSLARTILLVVSGYELSLQAREIAERHHYYNIARKYCDEVGKPLLRIGIKRSPLEPPNGDYTLDIDPIVLSLPGGVLGDERSMPFANKQFGVSFNEHTLEHLHNIEDVKAAISECCRVADHAILLAPSPYSIIGLLHPDHKLRMWFKNNNKIVVSQIRGSISQAIVISNPWELAIERS